MTPFQKRTIEAFGTDLVPIKTSHVLNQDETTMACTLGNKQQGSEARHVRLAPARADNSHHNDHADPKELKVEASKHFRIKKFTMFGAGGERRPQPRSSRSPGAPIGRCHGGRARTTIPPQAAQWC